MLIGIDMDAIVADLLSEWVNRYNLEYNDKMTVADVTCWNWHKLAKPECGTKLYSILHDINYLEEVKPLPGAIAAVNKLGQRGHEILMVSSPTANKENFGERIEWCNTYLGLSHREVILTHHKELLQLDILIDDSPDNLKKFALKNPEGLTFTIDYPYNKDSIVDFRAADYKDTRQAWDQILEQIHKWYE